MLTHRTFQQEVEYLVVDICVEHGRAKNMTDAEILATIDQMGRDGSFAELVRKTMANLANVIN